MPIRATWDAVTEDTDGNDLPAGTDVDYEVTDNEGTDTEAEDESIQLPLPTLMYGELYEIDVGAVAGGFNPSADATVMVRANLPPVFEDVTAEVAHGEAANFIQNLVTVDENVPALRYTRVRRQYLPVSGPAVDVSGAIMPTPITGTTPQVGVIGPGRAFPGDRWQAEIEVRDEYGAADSAVITVIVTAGHALYVPDRNTGADSLYLVDAANVGRRADLGDFPSGLSDIRAGCIHDGQFIAHDSSDRSIWLVNRVFPDSSTMVTGVLPVALNGLVDMTGHGTELLALVTGGLALLDRLSPNLSSLIGAMPTAFDTGLALASHGGVLYAINNNAQLWNVNRTDPSMSTRIGTTTLPGGDYRGAVSHGGELLAVRGDRRLVQVDTGNPSASTVITGTLPSSLSVQGLISSTVPADPGGMPTNQPPVWTAIPAVTVAPGSTYNFNLADHVSDPDGTIASYTATESSPHISVSRTGSMITVTGITDGTATVFVSATDDDGASASSSFAVTVTTANQPPVWSEIPAQRIESGGDVDVDLSDYVSDIDGTIASYAASESSPHITISRTGSVVTVSGVSDGTATVTVTATDDDGASTSSSFSVVVGAVAVAPVWSAIPDQEVRRNGVAEVDLYTYLNTGDLDVATLTLSIVTANAAVTSTLRDNRYLRLVGVSATGSDGVDITVRANNGEGDTADADITVVVLAAANTAPEWLTTFSQNLTVVEGRTQAVHTFREDIDYRDLDEGDTLTVSILGAISNNGITASLSADGVLSATAGPDAAVGNTFGVVLRVSDGVLHDDVTVTIEVVANQAPVIGDINEVLAVPPDGSRTFTLEITDETPAEDLTVTATNSNSTTVDVTREGDTYMLDVEAGTIAAGNTITVTVRAEDDGGLVATRAFTVTVNTAPMVISNQGIDAPGTAGGTFVRRVAADFTDPDDDTLTVVSVTSDSTAVTVAPTSDRTRWTYAIAAGTPAGRIQNAISLTITDGTETASLTLSVAVLDPAQVATFDIDVGETLAIDLMTTFGVVGATSWRYNEASADIVEVVSLVGNTLTVQGVADSDGRFGAVQVWATVGGVEQASRTVLVRVSD